MLEPSRTISRLSLYSFRFRWSLEGLPVCTNDVDFLSVKSRKLYRLTKKRVLVLLVVCGKRVLMDDHHVFAFEAGLQEVRQLTPVLGRQCRLFFSYFFLRPNIYRS